MCYNFIMATETTIGAEEITATLAEAQQHLKAATKLLFKACGEFVQADDYRRLDYTARALKSTRDAASTLWNSIPGNERKLIESYSNSESFPDRESKGSQSP